MKKWESYWKRFEKTGDIRDYLNYTACTREENEKESVELREMDATGLSAKADEGRFVVLQESMRA